MKVSESLGKRPALTHHVLPSLEEIRRKVDRVIAKWPDAVKVPEDRDREKLALEMLWRVREWEWKDVKTSKIISAAIAVFDAERCTRPDLKAVHEFFYEEIRTREAGSFLDALFWVYTETFKPGVLHTIELARALSLRKRAFNAKVSGLLQQVPALLDPQKAPENLGAIMVASDDPYARLRELGFRAPHSSGLVQAAHLVFVLQLAPKLREEAARKKLFAWLMPADAKGAVLQTGAREAIEALINAWKDRSAPDTVRAEISEAVIRAYNDPRLHRGGIWAGFDPALKAILLRWLTQQDMKFFCDMVTATQYNHMWPPRRDFWLGLFNEGRIDEAWVAFGSEARQYAQRHLIRSGESDFNRRFGRQEDRGGSTSLLIMRMGNRIVVDGCHSYQTHIFRMDDPNAPKLYQSRYACNDIMRQSKLSKTHQSIPVWREWVERHV